MAKVIANKEETVESLISRFKREVKKEGILFDYSKHDFFLKKSLRRKEKSKLARIKNK